MAFDTVTPAISTPQPKIINPKEANLADAGKDVHHEDNDRSKPEPTKVSLMA